MSAYNFSSSMSQIKRENSFSQLSIFKESKTEIIKVFHDIATYVMDSNSFFNEIYNSDAMFQSLINVDNVKLLVNFVEKVNGIQNVISRNNMKCAFFGRTSNGKSTTINAMLGGKILPTGIGHTTSCFLEIQGTDDNQGFIKISTSQDNSDETTDVVDSKPIDSVKDLARDVSLNKLSSDSLIKIYWPNEKCPLLSQDVVILDSPGIDVDPDIDKWIDMYCLDADVFVLVANSESTLNHTEKSFFHNVSNKLSKPNIFILNNRWDASADQVEYVKEVREQHMEKCVAFLSKELKVCSKTEAESRVFFVSASEALNMRSRKTESTGDSIIVGESPNLPKMREGWQSRLFEFTNFEKNLEKTLSESATKTKFAAHSIQGQEVVTEVRLIVEGLNEKAQEQKDAAVTLTHKMRTRSEKLDSHRKVVQNESLAEIKRLSEKVAERVADVLREELRRLGDVIDDFDHTFYEESGLLSKYKVELSQHVEKQLGNNLTSILARDLYGQVELVHNSILKKYTGLIQDKETAEKMRKSASNDYTPQFYVDCNNIASDFHEDLSFRFSLGPTAILGKLIGPIAPGRHPTDTLSIASSSNLLSMLAIRQVLPSITTRSVLVTVLCGGLILRATGWKVLGAVACIYGAIYGYEYSTWTSRAKEKAFKQQFRSYVAEKLELVMAYTSKISADQPQNSLTRSLKSLDGVVDKHINKLKEDITKFDGDVKRLEEIVSKSRSLKNKAIYLEKVLKNFHDKYIMV